MAADCPASVRIGKGGRVVAVLLDLVRLAQGHRFKTPYAFAVDQSGIMKVSNPDSASRAIEPWLKYSVI